MIYSEPMFYVFRFIDHIIEGHIEQTYSRFHFFLYLKSRRFFVIPINKSGISYVRA
jgi:hypothetical protein